MPLPDYSPRSDSFGNWYFGGFQMDSQVESGYGAGTQLTPTLSDWQTFIETALGVGNWATDASNNDYFIFSNPWETYSTASTTEYRFSNRIQSNRAYLNTKLSGTATSATYKSGSVTMYGSGICTFAVVNQYGAWFVSASNSSSVVGALSTTITSTYYGWVKDPVFPTDTAERIRNCVVGQIYSANAAGATTLNTTLNANSVITCQVANPDANITDLVVLDSAFPNLAIGSLHNSLFYPGTGLTIGQIYRIPPEQDPDGNTEQNIWLCAGQLTGWNGTNSVNNAGYKLIRVWSNNIA